MKLVSASLHVVRVVKVIQAFGKGTKEIMKIFKGEVGLFKNILDKIHSKMSKAAEFLYHVGESIKSNKLLGRISKFLAKTGKSLIKGIGKPFIKALGKYAGPLGILFMIGDGIKNLFNPDHTGWRGWVDRLLVGVGGIVCGALLGLAMLGAVTLAPVVLTIIAIVTAAITIWQLGNLIYDNRENISGWMSHVGAS